MRLIKTEKEWFENDMKIKEAMTRIPYSISPEISIFEAKEKMQEHQIWHFPVLKRGELVGMITLQDIQTAETFHGAGYLSVADAMVKVPHVVTAEESLSQVLATMLHQQLSYVLVINPRGNVIGIFTTHDALTILRALILLGRREQEEVDPALINKEGEIMLNTEKLYLTKENYELLETVTENYSGFQGNLLEKELARAEVVPSDEIPDNVITLHSRARVVDETMLKEREITVVPPTQPIHENTDQVSVLSPLGAAVIGLSEGQVIEWPMPSGNNRRFRVKKVLYQPEAALRSR